MNNGGTYSVRRIIAGCVAAILLPLTVYLATILPRMTLTSALLLLLFEVVIVAVVSNLVISVIVAVVAVLMANWFLVQPHHTFLISNPDDVVELAVFVLTAVGASLVVTQAQKLREAVASSELEASALRTSVGQRADEADPDDVLSRTRAMFGLEYVQLRDRQGSVVAAAGTPGEPAPVAAIDADVLLDIDEALPEGFRLVGSGPTRIGVDRRVLATMGTAALRSWQARQLADEASRAAGLAAADRARSALLASVGHDLRTPIAAISVAATALRSGAGVPPEDRDELVDTIAASAARLDDLVANLLDMSRLEAGSLIASIVPVVVEEALAQAAAESGSAQVDVRMETDLPEVCADPGLLDRVLANLVSNALRYSPTDAAVELTAEARAHEIRLAVVDHGPGMPDLTPDQLFRAFQRQGDTKPGGVGLGLAIARGFVEAMGGRITAEPTPGGGLTVAVFLKAAR